MKNVKPDTDRLLDHCECGARGGFMEHRRGCSADCTECANGTPVLRDKAEAMVEWNKMQRRTKGVIK